MSKQGISRSNVSDILFQHIDRALRTERTGGPEFLLKELRLLISLALNKKIPLASSPPFLNVIEVPLATESGEVAIALEVIFEGEEKVVSGYFLKSDLGKGLSKFEAWDKTIFELNAVSFVENLIK